jgi:hypothetical protein
MRLPEFLHNRHMKMTKLSALRTRRLYPLGKTPGTHFFQRPSRSHRETITDRHGPHVITVALTFTIYLSLRKPKRAIELTEKSLLVVGFLLGNSPASEFYMLTFRKTLFHLHRQVAYKIRTPWNHPEESVQHSQHGESLISRNRYLSTTIKYKTKYQHFFTFSVQ